MTELAKVLIVASAAAVDADIVVELIVDDAVAVDDETGSERRKKHQTSPRIMKRKQENTKTIKTLDILETSTSTSLWNFTSFSKSVYDAIAIFQWSFRLHLINDNCSPHPVHFREFVSKLQMWDEKKNGKHKSIYSPRLGAEAVVRATVDVGVDTAATTAAILASRLCSCGVCC